MSNKLQVVRPAPINKLMIIGAIHINKKGIRALIILCLSACLPVQASNAFVYEEQDGTVWLTNFHPKTLHKNKYTYRGTYGWSATTQACHKLTLAEQRQRERPYERVIDIYANQYGISPWLIKSIIWTESCFDSNAVSRVGAEGLMQLMPGTAKELGVKNSFDPIANIQSGVLYFSDLLKRFDQNVRFALAAYNAGPGAVSKYGGIPPYKETQKYVSKVLNKYRAYVKQAASR